MDRAISFPTLFGSELLSILIGSLKDVVVFVVVVVAANVDLLPALSNKIALEKLSSFANLARPFSSAATICS
jgi:hypothetical protein